MQDRKRKIFSSQMMKYELLNVLLNPYIHIFGLGLPIVLAMLITKVAVSELPSDELGPMVATTVYLGMGALIPMAVLLMGYAVSYAQELSKGIPERMHLFGIKNSVSFCNRALVQLLFLIAAFLLFFLTGFLFSDLKKPEPGGLVIYVICMVGFSAICLALAHGIACILRNFGKTYCVSMILYFAFMILGGMMGISYEDLPKWAQTVAKLLPVTYINKDFYKIWIGERYHFMPMVQSYLFLGAVSGILLFVVLKRRTFGDEGAK